MRYSSAYQSMAMDTNYGFGKTDNGEMPSERNFIFKKLAKTHETVKAKAEEYYPAARFVGESVLNHAADRNQDDWLIRYGVYPMKTSTSI